MRIAHGFEGVVGLCAECGDADPICRVSSGQSHSHTSKNYRDGKRARGDSGTKIGLKSQRNDDE